MKKLVLFLGLLPCLAFAQAVLPTSWNFSNPGVSTPPVGWSYNLTGNLTYASGIGDNISLRLDQQGEYLQINFADKPGKLSYYIKGTAISPNPPFTGAFTIQESADGTNWSTLRNFTSMTSTLTRTEEDLAPTSRFVRFFYTTKQSGSNVQLDSVLVLPAPPPPAGIMVKQNNTTLVSGNTFAYGNATSQLFTIQNFGISADLKVDSMVITGTNASEFSVGAFDSLTPFNNATDTFSVYFNPTANGSRFATLKIYSSDSERNPFDVNLYGIGGTLATEPTTQVGSVTISNVRTHTLNVSFSRAAGAEQYILLRNTAGSITEVPVDGVTYKRGDYIGAAQVAYIGNDTAMLKPNYILANTTYSFAAFSFNGPTGYENYNTTAAPSATATTENGTSGNYYNAIKTNRSTFITDLGNRIRTPHDTVFYSNYTSTIINNFLARDTANGKKIVECVYTSIRYIYEEPFGWNGAIPTGILTREHTFAQSWMPSNGGPGSGWPNIGGREVLEYNDLHNLFPAHQTLANVVRSNNPFGVVVNATSTSPSGFGKLGTNANGITVYEPRDEQKGDLARALFYMLVRYNGERGNQWRLPSNQDINVLLQWHQQDPPSAVEIARNEYIFSVQKNRNPFIDNPSWVNKINFSNLTYISDSATESITINAPVTGSRAVRGKKFTLSWSSQNVDSVLVEIKPSLVGQYTEVGRYASAANNSISPYMEYAVSPVATYRITKLSDATLSTTSGSFSIINSTIAITKPVDYDTLYTDSSYLIKWSKANMDSVDVRLVYNNGNSTLFLGSSVTATDSIRFTLPTNTGGPGMIIVSENPNTDKLFSYLSADTIIVVLKEPLIGLNTNTLLNQLVSVYPIPSSGEVTITVPHQYTVQQIEVFDLKGRLVHHTNTTAFNLTQKGMYVVRVITNQGVATKRIIIE